MTALAPIRARYPSFAELLATEPDAEMLARLRAAESIGRPLGSEHFLATVERLTARRVRGKLARVWGRCAAAPDGANTDLSLIIVSHCKGAVQCTVTVMAP